MRLGGGSLPATAEVEMAATAGTGGEGGLDATPSKICKKSSTHGMSMTSCYRSAIITMIMMILYVYTYI